jgi:uncharacterized phage-associated protein
MLIDRRREKLVNAIVYFARNTNSLGKIKLFKLLYLLDFEHFRQTGRSVTGLHYRAWKLGPVPMRLMQEWEQPEPDFDAALEIVPEQVIDHVRQSVRARVDFDESHFTRRELEIMQNLVDQYQDTFSPDMIDVTHAENGAWATVWNAEGFNAEIPYALSLAEDDENRETILEAAREYQAMIEARNHGGSTRH